MQRLAAADPGNAGWQRDLAASHNSISDVQRAKGELTTALAACQTGLEIMQRLPAADPGNACWQRDLSVSHNNVANLQSAQGDLTSALAAYRTSLEIRQRLAEADPGNAGWQRDLAVSHIKVGNVQSAQGDLTSALAAYRASLQIRQRLAEADPGNAGWQRDLVVCHLKFGRLFQEQGDELPARNHLGQAHRTLQSMRSRAMFLDRPLEQLLQALDNGAGSELLLMIADSSRAGGAELAELGRTTRLGGLASRAHWRANPQRVAELTALYHDVRNEWNSIRDAVPFWNRSRCSPASPSCDALDIDPAVLRRQVQAYAAACRAWSSLPWTQRWLLLCRPPEFPGVRELEHESARNGSANQE
jgi:tetratricopeptide (TPR) repeat protein